MKEPTTSTKWISTRSLALRESVSLRRIQAKIKRGQYPSARRCECGDSWLIDEQDTGKKSSSDRNSH